MGDLSNINPLDYNILFVTLDSCRYDITQKATIPFLNSIGIIRKALSHADATFPSHTIMFDGRLPSVEEPPFWPFYTDSVKQLWRISLQEGFFNTRSKIALSLKGNNIVEGYSNFGYFTLGASSLGCFTKGSTLNSIFNTFLDYYNYNSKDRIDPRKKEEFPLIHINEIVRKIKIHEKWFLFINTVETHYPYDIGNGYSKNFFSLMQKVKKHLNLRHSREFFTQKESKILQNMQISALEMIDKRLKKLVNAIPKNRPILMIVCGDHGESFGEEFYGFPRCGHFHCSPEVLEVPLLISIIN